jgi:hypothetical protein
MSYDLSQSAMFAAMFAPTRRAIVVLPVVGARVDVRAFLPAELAHACRSGAGR